MRLGIHLFSNKVHVITPCLINDALTERITYSDSWCSPLELSKSICKESMIL